MKTHTSPFILETRLPGGAVWRTEDCRVTVTCHGDGIWKTSFTWAPGFASNPHFGLLHEPVVCDVEVSEDTEGWELMAYGHRGVTVRRNPFQVVYHGPSGQPVLATHPQRGIERDSLSGRIRAWFTRHHQDVYFGLGEKSGGLAKNRKTYFFGASDAAGYESEFSDPLYKNIPFLLTGNRETGGFHGLLFATAWEGHINLGSLIDAYYESDFHAEFAGGALETWFFAGPTPADVLVRYGRVSGTTALPPKYTLGWLASGMYPSEQENAAEALQEFVRLTETYDLPCDGWHLSSGYTVSPEDGKRYVFTWNRNRFPDPGQLLGKLRAKGIRVAPNVKPFLLTTHPMYAELEAQGLFVREAGSNSPLKTRLWGGLGSYLDFTNTRARLWWKRKLTEELLALGAEGVWNDNNEYSLYDEGICDGEGSPYPVLGLKAVLTSLMARTSREALLEHAPDRRPWVISRGGWAGLQALAQTWSGDNSTGWHELKWNQPLGLGLGLSGVANNGHDIGGFLGPMPTPESFLRWCQFGLFLPRFTIHSTEPERQPWTFPEVLPQVRGILLLRYRLIPFLYSLFDEARRTGAPLNRPMLWHFPDQTGLWEESFQFMVGEHLLTAPVTAPGATDTLVRLPAGHQWTDWFTGQRWEGGQEVRIAAPWDRFVLLLRDGTILPLQTTAAELELQLVFPDAETSRFDLYDDDGETNDEARGVYHRRSVFFTPLGQHRFELRLEPAEGTFVPTWKTLVLTFREEVRYAAYDGQWHLTFPYPSSGGAVHLIEKKFS